LTFLVLVHVDLSVSRTWLTFLRLPVVLYLLVILLPLVI